MTTNIQTEMDSEPWSHLQYADKRPVHRYGQHLQSGEQRVYMETPRLAGHPGPRRCVVVRVNVRKCGINKGFRHVVKVQSAWQDVGGSWGPIEPRAVTPRICLLPARKRFAEDAVNREGAGELDSVLLLRAGEGDALRVFSAHVRALLLLVWSLGDALSPAPEHAVRKRVLAVGVEHPVVVLPPGSGGVSEHFEKAVIEGEVVAHGVPPARVAAAEEGELLHQVVVDFCQSQAATGGLPDGHGDQGDVGVRWLRSSRVGLAFPAVPSLTGDRCRTVGYAVPV